MANTVQNWALWRDEIASWTQDESIKAPEPMSKRIFAYESTNDLESTDFSWSGYGLMQEVGEMGNSVEDDALEGYAYTFARRVFRKHSIFSSDLFETGKKLKAEEIARDLARAVNYSREVNIWGMIRNAFNPLWTYGDAKPLVSVAHPLKNGSGTQANTFADGVQLALSSDAVKSLQDQLNDMVSNSGNSLSIGAKPLLLVSPRNRVKAFEIAESDGKVDSADNNANYYKGGLYDVLEVDWMKYMIAKQAGEITAAQSDASNIYDSMWALVDPDLAKKYFKVKVASGYAKYDEEMIKSNQALKKYAYDKYTFGATGYFPIAMSKGDGTTYTG